MENLRRMVNETLGGSDSVRYVGGSEEKYRAIFESVNDVIVTLDMKGNIMEINSKVEEISGYTRAELVGKNIAGLRIFPPKSLAIILKNFAKRIVGMSVPPYDVELISKEGKRIFVEINAIPLRVGGKIVGDIAVLRDISERRRMEDNLKESEERLRTIFENVGDVIIHVDKYGRVLDVNRKIEEIFGYKKEDLVGKKFTEVDVFDLNNLPEVVKIFSELIQGKSVVIPELEIKDVNGDTILVETSAGVIRKRGKVEGVAVILRDISECKRMEVALKQSEEKYRGFFETTKDCVFIVSEEGAWVDCNDAAAKFFGYGSRDDLMDATLLDMYVDPKDWEEHARLVGRKGYVKEYPVNLSKKDGTLINALITSVLRRDDGHILGYMGTIRDVTEQMRTEEALRESENFFFGTLNDMLTFVAVLKPDGRVVFVNNTPLEIAGIKLGDVVGKVFYDVCWWTYSEEARQTIKRDIEQCALGKTLSHHIQVQTLDGLIWIEFSIHPIFDESGGVKYVVPEGRDITESKRAEDELNAKVVELERFNKLMVGRELKMVKLKREINELSMRLGEKPPYEVGVDKGV